MLLRILNFFLLGSLAAFMLLGLWTVRRPLCIDSRVVERVDRISLETTERVWKCGVNQDVPYSPWMALHLSHLQDEVTKVERSLQSLSPFLNPVRIVVVAHRPWVYRVHEHTIFIGEELLRSEGHLSRGLIKSWIRERNELFGEGELREEVYADLLQTAIFGEFQIEDLERGLRTRLGAKWPQVLKEAKSYCASPWKLSEHYELCGKDIALFEKQAALWSLRPLLSTALIESWNRLGVFEKVQGLREVTPFLNSEIEDVFEQKTQGLEGALTTVSTFERDFESRANQAGVRLQKIALDVKVQLQKMGFQGEAPGIEFDLLVSSEEKVGGKEEWLHDLAKFARLNGKMKIAVRDEDKLWVLPSLRTLEVKPSDVLKGRRLTVLHCADMSFEKALSYQSASDKVLFVHSCRPQAAHFWKWAVEGAESFAKEEKHLPFVQVHLPSLLLKKDQLDLKASLYALKGSEVPSKVFGWQEVKWFEQAKAYKPKAALDAIEWFRTESL